MYCVSLSTNILDIRKFSFPGIYLLFNFSCLTMLFFLLGLSVLHQYPLNSIHYLYNRPWSYPIVPFPSFFFFKLQTFYFVRTYNIYTLLFTHVPTPAVILVLQLNTWYAHHQSFYPDFILVAWTSFPNTNIFLRKGMCVHYSLSLCTLRTFSVASIPKNILTAYKICESQFLCWKCFSTVTIFLMLFWEVWDQSIIFLVFRLFHHFA